MLTAEENELLTRVGPGTRMGNLLRCYWQPVAGLSEMAERWTLRVRMLGEDLVLFKTRAGAFGLIGESCPHRGASLAYGIPTQDGIRCAYHGWCFDAGGRCLEQPNESESHALRGAKVATAYPVQELGGLLFAYLGPEPAPLLPRFDGYVAERAIRHLGKRVIPCNWLQIMENSVDPVHTEWLHGALYEFRHEGEGRKVAISKHHAKIAFDEFPFGIIKRRLMENQSEDSDDWRVGHPLLFPNTLSGGSNGGLWKQQIFQIRVPMDDTNTMHFWYHAYIPPDDADVPAHLLTRVPVYEPPVKDSNGEFLLDYIHAQDIMAWTTQGTIADRTKEKLGASDRGLVMYRKLLKREIEKVERGEDPVGIVRDARLNRVIDLPREKGKDMYSDGFVSQLRRQMSNFSPIAEELIEVFTKHKNRDAITRAREPVPAK
ncbi:MAG: aromatic ring-hydroxylating dioxygenase subunit alpha [Alphaproteobacteria bacterium]|nr:aromatic ring-hydroxylating dioxygenase subunit alpha [Alphaproteobacteria bacterium]